MIRLYVLVKQASTGHRLAFLIGGLRVIGGLGFIALAMNLIREGDYLHAALSSLMCPAWLAATMEARDWVLERFP
jgi:hypothetical protein